jgi:hypothetical protein
VSPVTESSENGFWMVKSPFDFDNIGFSKTAMENMKFLSCADCDLGPLGFQALDCPQVGILIYRNRVRSIQQISSQ